VLGLLLAIVTAAVYYQVHAHPFLGADDYFYIVENTHVQAGLRWSTVQWAFTTLAMVNWIPIIWLSHAADYQMFGLNPSGHHIVNVVLHAFNAALLFWVLKRATGYTGRSFMVAALFALHPINVEPVVWIAELKTMLSTTFLLLALGAYRWYAEEPRLSRYTVVVLLFALALMSKPQVIMLPLVLLLWDYWPLRRMFPPSQRSVEEEEHATAYPGRSIRWLVIEKLPLLALAALDGLITLKVQGAHPRYWSAVYSHAVRLENAIVAYARYVGKALWPAWLSIDYPHPGGSLTAWQISGALLLLVVITALVLLHWHERYLVVGWFWFLLTLLPMIGLVQVGTQAMQDRYAYDSFVGLFIMVCWGVASWAKERHISVPWLAGASAAVLLALTMVTIRQIGYWQDTFTLYSHAARVVRNNWEAEDVIAEELTKQGDPASAMQHYYTANAINPNDALSNLRIGFFEQTSGNPQGALLHFERALHAGDLPAKARPLLWRNMGVAYRDMGDLASARKCFEKSANATPH
ncbi:MAG TPA: hypothetical protein VH164_02340, partial [Ktedonobacteraceae bacterium]|nr:hypothetical protein [Ktedonobacteraceae bacterium]